MLPPRRHALRGNTCDAGLRTVVLATRMPSAFIANEMLGFVSEKITREVLEKGSWGRRWTRPSEGDIVKTSQ